MLFRSSDRWKDPRPLERLAQEFPHVLVIAVDAQHDVAGQAPAEVIAMTRKFIERI